MLTQDDMDQSGLILSDGIMAVSTLERALSARVPSLVVLSSCDSAAEHLNLTDAPTLATAFLQAGVRCVVGTAWPVPDDIAADTTQAFYELFATNGPVASLNAARRRLNSAGAHAYAHSFKVMGWD